MGPIDNCRGFLGRLARDVRGNTIAIMAAAMMPLAGLIGGGVDMSRLYLTKTRLQQACDAGALAGRKAMAAGSWTTGTGNGSTNDKAEKMFAANFVANQYGTGTLAKGFSEANGIVSGTASAIVPMTIMKVFGMTSRTLSVSCTAKMELPNTDVMFVLDVTYSMGCDPAATSDSCTQAPAGSQRIDGLKKAVKCFYEALERVATPEPCTFVSGTTYNSTGDPTATTASTTAQVRIGFVPYGVNVNVGKILPNSAMGDTWTYQSRVANTQTVYGWTLGTESSLSAWGSWSPSSTPSTYNTASGFSGFATPSSNQTVNSVLYSRQRSDITTQANCEGSTTGLNSLSGSSSTLVAREDLPGTATSSLTSTTYPANSIAPNDKQTLTYTNTDPRTVNGYRYKWKKNPSNASSNSCWLEKGSANYSRTQTATSTKQINWTTYAGVFRDWTYKPASLNVAALKTGGSNWANSVAIAGLTTGTVNPVTHVTDTPKLSGQSSATTLTYPASLTVGWGGCIEEAKTFQSSATSPAGDWATVPSGALDMNINLVPGTPTPSYIFSGGTYTYSPGSYWGPMLQGAVWARYTDTEPDPADWNSAAWTRSDVTTSATLDQDNYSYICTASAARKLAEYRTSSNFVSYVNSLTATDLGTYHDIGMLWGARLISPTGIFASENATAATGGAIQRHLIFMTDGNTRTVHNNYNAYGLSFYNRYQTSYDPSTTQTDDLTNARLLLICNQIKNQNITLWVVSYGMSVGPTTVDRLKQCSTGYNTTTHTDDGIHFVSATNTAGLIAQFQTIAAKISELRLTS